VQPGSHRHRHRRRRIPLILTPRMHIRVQPHQRSPRRSSHPPTRSAPTRHPTRAAAAIATAGGRLRLTTIRTGPTARAGYPGGNPWPTPDPAPANPTAPAINRPEPVSTVQCGQPSQHGRAHRTPSSHPTDPQSTPGPPSTAPDHPAPPPREHRVTRPPPPQLRHNQIVRTLIPGRT